MVTSITDGSAHNAPKTSFHRFMRCYHYILIAQDTCRVEHFTRQPGNHWTKANPSDPQNSVDIAVIDCHLRLADIYDKVDVYS